MHTCTLSCTLSIELLVENCCMLESMSPHFHIVFSKLLFGEMNNFRLLEKVKPYVINVFDVQMVFLNESLSIQSFTIVKNLSRSMSIIMIIHNVHRSKSWIILEVNLSQCVILVFQSSHWVGTVLLNTCRIIERPSKKDGFCFKLFHPLDQSIWATKVRTRAFISLSTAFKKLKFYINDFWCQYRKITYWLWNLNTRNTYDELSIQGFMYHCLTELCDLVIMFPL